MHKQITFHQMDHSKVIEDYANEHLEKIEKFLQNERTPIYIELTFTPSKVHAHHRVELLVKSPNYDLHVEREGSDFYKTLDDVIDTMYHNLHKEKRKELDKKKESGRPEKRKWKE